jgi:menaquinone-9 beta-reductase
MRHYNSFYDVAIIGGGIAGLTLAIRLAQDGRKVIVYEKNKYPFHRVCGEYVSMESAPFLERLGVELKHLDLPRLTKLFVSSPSGKSLKSDMKTGGFGISRYLFDNLLKEKAVASGAVVMEDTAVENIVTGKYYSIIKTRNDSSATSVVAGTFGKRSKLDTTLGRKLHSSYNNSATNYVGIKYHIKADLPTDTIELHNFKNGYCGISAVENGVFCLCYLTTAENLKVSGNSIQRMESEILMQNPYLKKYFAYEKIFESPVSISQINFSAKLPVEEHVLMIGDAAGMIAPLCGNGMSMAMNGTVLCFPIINDFLDGKISRDSMENSYTKKWNAAFSARLRTGRIIQGFFGSEKLTDLFVSTLNKSPYLVRKLVNLTHGKQF